MLLPVLSSLRLLAYSSYGLYGTPFWTTRNILMISLNFTLFSALAFISGLSSDLIFLLYASPITGSYLPLLGLMAASAAMFSNQSEIEVEPEKPVQFSPAPVDANQMQNSQDVQFAKTESAEPKEAVTGSDNTAVRPTVRADVGNINSVREAIITDFSVSDALVASALMQTKNWRLENDNVCVTIEVAFERIQLQQHSERIAKYLSEMYGKQMGFVVNLEEKSNETVEVTLPVEVQILRDAFKGALV